MHIKMWGLHLISCIIFICIFETSQMPLKQNTIISGSNNYMQQQQQQQLNSYYYPSSLQSINEVHDLALTDGSIIDNKSEMMESSASNYYSHHDVDSEYSDSDYATGTIAPLHENFESEKIVKKTSDNKKLLINNQSNMSEILSNSNEMNNSMQQQQQQQHSLNLDATHDNAKLSKLLFSSPSATVTSNGPSGPFKAIICHDCENSGGVNVGHSVSFSAIKSWNVGSTNAAALPSTSFNDSSPLVIQQNHENYNVSTSLVEHTSEKYFESNKDTHAQINHNAAAPLIVENQGNSLVKSEVTVNDSGQQQPLSNKNWNYSHLTVRNENIKINNPLPTSEAGNISNSPTVTNDASNNNSNNQKKPIFNDLLKVPYDVLNAPLTESPPLPSAIGDAIKNTQIHINHQQKFNDTVTNYQHFQQFIQKNPNSNSNPNHNHYQSTPMPEQNYEVDESVSLMTNGRAHGVQSTTPKIISHLNEEKSQNHNSNNHHGSSGNIPQLHATHDVQDSKFGVVFEGRDFRKYKVEEKTADGFIVGEYGYLSNTDGSPIFGVRYTADSNINPQLIYDALLKFLKL